MSGIASISKTLGILCGFSLLALLIAALVVALRPLPGEKRPRFTLTLVSLAAIMIMKFALLPFFPGFDTDIIHFEGWAALMAVFGPAGVYSPHYETRYAPAYLYALWPAGVLASMLPERILPAGMRLFVESPPLIADFLLGLAAYAALRRMAAGRLAFAGTLLVALNPPLVFTSLVWGQNDSLLALPMLLSMLLAAQSCFGIAWAMAALAVLTKAQGLLALPMLAWWTVLSGRFSNWLRAAAGFLATAIVVILPFQLSHGWHWIIDVYESSLDFFPLTSVNAFNLMAILGGFRNSDATRVLGISFLALGNCLMAVTCLLAGYILWCTRTMRGLLFSLFLTYLGFFVLSTRVHERYLYFAVVLGAPLIFDSWAMALLYCTISATLLLNLIYVAFSPVGTLMIVPLDGPAITASLINIAAFAAAAIYGVVVVCRDKEVSSAYPSPRPDAKRNESRRRSRPPTGPPART
jgi:dolichyl-phosphate-mannose-protein mannosyltransferase